MKNKLVPSVSVTYARNGSSTKANALGMRPMQERAYEKRGEQYLLIKSPPASGKSRALMFIALDKLHNQGLRQAIIVVPEKSIGASFNDEALTRFTDPAAGPLFADQNEEGDEASGIVYVLRSKSDHPTVVAHRDVLHKIGVTGGDVARRLANARLDPTFLMADVEIVATYELYNINRSKLENVIHRVFGAARLDIEVKDRFGQPVIPREWFLVPLFIIDEAIERIKDGTIASALMARKSIRLIPFPSRSTFSVRRVTSLNHSSATSAMAISCPSSFPIGITRPLTRVHQF